MNLAALAKKDPQRLLHAFIYGSLLVLLACLFGTALVFSATYLKKEQSRAAISTDQLSHFFDFQYRSVTEEMWTQNYEAINLRIASIARQLGRAGYGLVLTNEGGTCVYASASTPATTPCQVPDLLKQEIQNFRPGPPQPTLRFDNSSNQYVYMVPLYVGAVLKGYLYASISDPYDFYRGNSIVLALKIFILPIACVVLIWLAWLLVSKRFILRPYLSALVNLEKKQALGELAAQVAHDIRSPLVTGKSVVKSLTGISEKQRRLLTASYSRIEHIANELITQFISTSRADQESFSFLSAVVDSIVAEKIAMLGERTSVEIRSDVPTDLCLVGVSVSANDLSRVLSNLINNAIEAVRDRRRGIVSVRASAQDGKVCIAIEDNGKGIPEDTLHKLRTFGGTYGKSAGAGMGLHHAKATVAKAGGSLAIDSVPERGTEVRLELPSVQPPAWCARSVDLTNAQTIVVLDDDESVHLLWRQRLGDKNVVYLSDPEQFDINQYPPNSTRYIFDHEICGSPVTGLDLIVSNKLGDRAVLVTSYFNEPKIQRAVEIAGASILPKFMISKVDILGDFSTFEHSGTSTTAAYDLVLIDDDSLLHDLWAFDAEQIGKTLLAGHNAQVLRRHEVIRSTPIYIDKNLASGVSGLDVAKELYEAGYRNLYITTGDTPDSVPPSPFVRGVIGKGFPLIS